MPVSKDDAVRNSRIDYGRRGAVNTVLICRIGSTQKG